MARRSTPTRCASKHPPPDSRHVRSPTPKENSPVLSSPIVLTAPGYRLATVVVRRFRPRVPPPRPRTKSFSSRRGWIVSSTLAPTLAAPTSHGHSCGSSSTSSALQTTTSCLSRCQASLSRCSRSASFGWTPRLLARALASAPQYFSLRTCFYLYRKILSRDAANGSGSTT